MTTTTHEDPTADLKASVDVLADPARRQQAARVLLDELRRMTRAALPRVGDDDRDEVAQRVAISLWQRSERGKTAPDSLRTYLRRSIVHAYADILRQRRKGGATHVPFDDAAHESAPAATEWSFESERLAAEDLRRLLEPIVETAVDSRLPQYRADLGRDIDQLFRLARGTTSMDDELRNEGVRADAPPAERKTLVDRMLKRHQRAREALDKAIATLHARGRFNAEEAADARRLCQLLLRCQRSTPSDVSSSRGDEP